MSLIDLKVNFSEFLNEKRILEDLGDFPELARKVIKKRQIKYIYIEYYDDKEGICVKSNRNKVILEHDKGGYLHADLLYHYLEVEGYNIKLKKV